MKKYKFDVYKCDWLDRWIIKFLADPDWRTRAETIIKAAFPDHRLAKFRKDRGIKKPKQRMVNERPYEEKGGEL